MKNRVLRFSYEDTDNSIEIDLFGLIFEINKEKIIDKDIKDIKDINRYDVDTIENEIKELIGEDAIRKINSKRIKDGYKEMTLDVEVAVLTCIYKSYITATSGGMIDGIMDTNKKLEEEARGINREQRRSYRKDYNRNYNRNYNRRNHRRY